MESIEKDNISITGSDESSLPPESCRMRKIGSYFPKSTPIRPTYLAIRSTSAILGVVLVLLAVLATCVVHRPRWLDPILSPAINAWSASGIDMFLVLRRDKRYPRLQRLLHDGAIGIGCAVAAGFLVAFTLGDIRGTRDGSSTGTAAVAWLILFCMFAER